MKVNFDLSFLFKISNDAKLKRWESPEWRAGAKAKIK